MHPRLVTPTLALVLACTSGPDAATSPAATSPAANTPAANTPAANTPAANTPSPSPPIKPDDAKPAAPPVTPTAAAASPSLRVLARREGSLEIMAQGGRPWLSYEGEPVPLVDGAFERLPQGSKGMMECENSEGSLCYASALAGEPGDPLGVWLTVFTVVERVGDIHHVYHHDGQQWREVTLREQDLLVGYYPTLVVRGSSIIGTLGWEPNPDKESWAGEAGLDEDPPTRELHRYRAARDKALRKAKSGFVTVAGPETPLPQIPKGLQITDTVVTADGTLWALANTPWKRDQPATYRLLAWASGAVKAKTVAVPDLERVDSVSLWSNDDRLILGGCATADPSADELNGCTESYLAIGEGEAWERVAIDLPAEHEGSRDVLGAAREPSGALWVAFGSSWVEDEIAETEPVWHRPAGGAWQVVPVPTSEAAIGKPLRPHDPPGWNPQGLVWAAGAVWVALTDNAIRSVVLTSQPGEGPPAELPTDEVTNASRTPLPEIPEPE